MRTKRFKTGDQVIYIITGQRYVIISDGSENHNFMGSTLTPNEGFDYVIVEDAKDGFSSFVHVNDSQLDEIN